MDYQFENLGPERFQQFCQSLLINTFPQFQCLPVGQPDGGRDAIAYYQSLEPDKFIVFQVKFVRKPLAEKEPHKWLIDVIEKEAPKVKQLIPKGAEQYYLLTNVPGTSHLDAGSIDTVNGILNSLIDIPSTCWWRDDLNRQLDNAWDLKWAYPEIMTGIDMLRYIIQSRLSEGQERRTSAIKAFIRDQYEIDQEVRFKQIDLQNKLLDLFIDVPVALRQNYANERQRRLHLYVIRSILSTIEAELQPSDEYPNRRNNDNIRAATMLLHPLAQEHIPYSVIEGAPGQGKSTIAQYICQVHRMRILGETSMIEQIPLYHKGTPARLPFKVDLRDLATWLNMQDPFSTEDTVEKPKDWHKSLESFLAAQVRHHSGGFEFSVVDLHEIAKLSPILLVFDGLDEVADISKRREVISEIITGVNRLRESAKSLQVIVTSRPAAFANSPGFPEKEFPHYELTSITRTLINGYTEKWIKARRLDSRDSANVKRILKEKLDQPHLRDLARNPMQLAILLSLIHTRGTSLPDKRTALYDSYVDLFFNREAEKNLVVREYRNLLIDIHQYLAWILHSESERENSRGSISSERLQKLIYQYLEAEEQDVSIADALFTGVLERVVAIVSRVEGTYEFEVQPLREYFAARYLYETAPYSPTGCEYCGTKPDRFDAIARNFYWFNVTRFYAGCYSKGELPSLVDRIEELTKEEGYKHINHPRILAATLLSDWVFSQHPKSMKKIVSIILNDLGLRYILDSQSLYRRRVTETLVLPLNCGRNELLDKCFEVLETTPPDDYALEVINLIRANSKAVDIKQRWEKRLLENEGTKRTKWMQYGLFLGLLPRCEQPFLEAILADAPLERERLLFLFEANKIHFIEAAKERLDIVINSILEREIVVHQHQHVRSLLGAFAQIFNPYQYMIPYQFSNSMPLSEMRKRFFGTIPFDIDKEGLSDVISSSEHPLSRCAKAVQVFEKESFRPVKEWISKLSPWDVLVENLRTDFGDKWGIFYIANIASGIKSRHETCKDFSDLFDHSRSLCRRTRYARLRAGNSVWWGKQLESARNEIELMFALLVLLSWGSSQTLVKLLDVIDSSLSHLSKESWLTLAYTVKEATTMAKDQMNINTIPIDVESVPQTISEKTIAIIEPRIHIKNGLALYSKFLSDYQGNDPVVLERCQKLAVQLLLRTEVKNDPNIWQHHLSIIRRSYRQKVISDSYTLQFVLSQNVRESLSVEISQEIAGHPEEYPSYLVNLAEEKCREFVASKITPVAVSARKEGWFRL